MFGLRERGEGKESYAEGNDDGERGYGEGDDAIDDARRCSMLKRTRESSR